jgi:hypothetical protein
VDLLVVLLVNLVVLVDPVDKFQSLLLTWYWPQLCSWMLSSRLFRCYY